MIGAQRLAALISAKLCHDFAEPLNALVPGLDLLQQSPLAQKSPDAVSLIEQGVEKAKAKLNFFRLALTDAHPEAEAALEDIRETALALFAQLKSELVWRAPPVALSNAATRVVLNLLLIAADCAPRGVVEIDASAGEVSIAAVGPRAKFKPASAAALRGDTPEGDLDGRSIQPALTGLMARVAGIELAVRESEDRVDFTVRSAALRTISAAA
jgi:histidine phosphotransferase ChpT